MPRTCSVANCSNRCGREVGIKFFSFPSISDKRGRDLPAGKIQREKWIQALRIVDFPTNKQQIHNRSICSAHFSSGYPSDIPEHPDYVPHINMGYNVKPLDPTKYYRLQRRNKLKYVTNEPCCKSLAPREYSDTHMMVHTAQQSHKLCEESEYEFGKDLISSGEVKIKTEFVEEDATINYGAIHGVVKQETDETDQIADFELIQVKTEQYDEEIRPESKSDEQFGLKEEELDTSGLSGGAFAFIKCEEPFDSNNSQYNENDESGPSNSSYTCEICNKSLASKRSFSFHMMIHTGQQPHKCDVCNKRFLRNGDLKQHVRIHTGEKPFDCEFCDKKFTQRSSLTVHTRLHTGERLYKCDVCDKKFTLKSHLVEHMRLHTGEKPYECNICDKKFSQKSSLNTHIKMHNEEKEYKCHLCDKSFINKSNLDKHIRLHTGEKPFQCEFCAKTFTESTSLILHLRVHTREKPYKCEVCDRRFTQKSSLTLHLRLHTGEKPFKCDLCERTFTLKHCLTSHTRSHTGEKPFQCEVCEKWFTQKHHLKKHFRKQHTEHIWKEEKNT